jgi:hypothetical protein
VHSSRTILRSPSGAARVSWNWPTGCACAFFNTTRLGGITIKDEQGAPLLIRIYLEVGGFTGEFSSLNGETVYETPGGAVIRIQGTRFLIVYDADTRTTIAGNFEGSLTIESAGSEPLEVRPGNMRRAEAGSQPGPERPIPFNQVEYEARQRSAVSSRGAERTRRCGCASTG